MWSSLLSVSLLIHCTIARPQGQEDTLAPFNPENLLGESSGTQLIASGDTSSGGNPGRQQTWVEDPESALLASADCNGAILDQTIHPRRSRRSPEIKDSCDLQRPPQQLEEGAEKPVQLNPSSNTPNQPKKNQGPSQSGVDRAVAEQMFRIVFGAPGVNGEQNPDICNIPGSPMLRVPICAPPIWMTSPAILVMPARFCKLSISLISWYPTHYIF